MIALDSSILLRYLTGDDASQSRVAAILVEERLSADEPGYVSIVALIEMIWVLRRGYGYSAEQVDGVVERLLHAAQLEIGDRPAVERALAKKSGGLADRIIHELGLAAGCTETVTFDRRFARAKDVRLLSG